MKSHLFILSMQVINAYSDEEVQKTIEGLKEMGLYKLPYPNTTVRIPFSLVPVSSYHPLKQKLIRMFGEKVIVPSDREDRFFVDIPNLSIDVHLDTDLADFIMPDKPIIPGDNTYPGLSIFLRELLIAILATRNIIKEVKKDKLANLGIGKRGHKHRYSYTTTIQLPPKELMENLEGKSSGKILLPHFRRGHIRHQHYGPKNSYIKKIWIEPTIVNADKDFVDSRKAYNLG